MRPSRCLLLALVLTGLAGCITPSIPIPPPSPERMVFEVDAVGGVATFTYPANDNYADAIVYVYNRTIGEGIITHAAANGSIQTGPFPADFENEVAVTIEADEQIVSTCVVIHETAGPTPTCEF
jgi:hypothetical protein